MSLLTRPIPPKPPAFGVELAPVGVELRFFSAWRERPMLDWPARIAAIHTNAARGEGDVDSALAWSERNTYLAGTYTIAHYQFDRDGRTAKILPTNRRGICNATVLPGSDAWDGLTAAQKAEVLRHPYNVSRYSIAFETADTGTDDDETISAFTEVQADRIATVLAFEHLCPENEIPLQTPADWFGSGVGAHTEPFPFPFWTVQRGKTCPGAKKKAQVAEILARARQIVAAWTAPDPTPNPTPTPTTEEDDPMRRKYLAKLKTNVYHVREGDGTNAVAYRSNEYRLLKQRFDTGTLPSTVEYVNPLTGAVITRWEDIPALTEDQLDQDVGYLDPDVYAGDEG